MGGADIDPYALQVDTIDRFNSFVNNFKKMPTARINTCYLNGRADGLKALWAEFLANHKAIVACTPSTARASHSYFIDSVFDRYEEKYFDVLGEKQLAASCVDNTPAQAANGAANVAAQPNAQHMQLPRLNVPKFSGNYENWTSFRDLFISAVHSNASITPVHKLQYLKSLLTDEAEILLKYVPITDENYTVAWKTLRDRFDNKRALITTYLRQLLTQKSVDELAVGVRTLLDTNRECINALSLLVVDTTSWDCILIFIISQHIPHTTLTLWEQSIARNTLPTMKQLFEFLENRFPVLEFTPTQSQVAATTYRSQRPRPQQAFAVVSSCHVCKGPQHPLRNCPAYIQMLPQERLTLVTKSKLCTNRLAYSHQTQACPRNGSCNSCGARHHSMLHLGTPESSSTSAPVHHASVVAATPTPHSNQHNSASNSPQHNSASTSHQSASNSNSSPPASQASSTRAPNPFGQSDDATSSNRNISALISRPSNASPDGSILSTALVHITANNRQTHVVRALLDNASEENFVSSRVPIRSATCIR